MVGLDDRAALPSNRRRRRWRERQVTEYRGEVWQDGMRVAAAYGQSLKRIKAETLHYGIEYAQDGDVILKFFRKLPGKRWQKVTQ